MAKTQGFTPLYYQILFFTLGCFFSTTSNAQVTSDATVNTQVTQNGNVAEITGGETQGGNLFHSFQDFSVNTGNSAAFNNTDNITNIFSRVTGGNISNIDGLIRANGTANLFLINPAGIIFGENASLDVGGSFYASSASSIVFNEGEFSATDITTPPTLTINAPIGLGFRDQPGDIINRSNFNFTSTVIEGVNFNILNSVGLEVNPNQTFALIGGNIILEKAAGISAPGGQVELGGLIQAGQIKINENGSLTFPEGIERGNVTLTQQSRVKVAASGGGSINVNVKNLELNGQSELYAGVIEEARSPDAQAGNIIVNATDTVRLVGLPRQAPLEAEALTIERDTATGIRNTVGLSSVLRNDGSRRSQAQGNGGNIEINAQNLDLTNATVLDTSVFGQGDGGNITINASDAVVFDQGVILSQIRGFNLNRIKEQGNGDAGDVSINAKSLLLTDQAFILADVQQQSNGNGGNINIQVVDQFIQNQDSFILTQLGRNNIGSAGDITIQAGTYEISARNILPALQSDTQPDARGDAGNITIDVKDTFSLSDNLIISQIQTDAVGNAGNINVTANNISLDDFAFISSSVRKDSLGIAGKVNFTADTITISNGSIVDALTESTFDAGNISINANDLNILSGGKIVTASENTGNAGDINLFIKDQLVIDNMNPLGESPFEEPILQEIATKTGLFANTFPGSISNGGNIFISTNSLNLKNRSFISAETTSGQGGNINLVVADKLSLDNNSLISAQAFNNAEGGNLTIDTQFIVAYPNTNSDILASAQQGQGGNITIDAESLFGIDQRPLNNLTNDINASSLLQGLDGTIKINNADTTHIEDVIKLPTNLIEPQQTTAQACQANKEAAANNRLLIRGKGGIPASPEQPLVSQNFAFNGQYINTINPVPESIKTSVGKIQLARGIKITKSGRVVLTAYPTNSVGERVPPAKANCNQI